MNKIEELIQQYCPNGVEFKELQEVVVLTMGTSPAGNTFSPNPEDGIEFHQGKTSFGNEIIKHSNIYTTSPIKIAEPDSLIMSVRAPVGATNLTDRRIAIGRGLCSMIGKNGLMTKFLYYFINDNIQAFKNKSNGSTFEAINTIDIKQIQIPIPPLPIQQEIVTILDSFTQLEAELEAELEARRAQYEYYRAKLLNFSNLNGGGCEVRWVEMQKVFDMKNGYTPSKSKSEYWTNGSIPWFRMEDIRQNGRILSDSIQYITPDAVKGNGLIPANSIIVSTSATIGEHALITVDFLANQRFTCLTRKKEYTNDLNMRYFQYYMFVIDEWCKNNINISGFAGVDMPKFKSLKIPIPPLSEQNRIVEVLDKFDSLVNDISIGLPAEIEARRKQYEYYRGKLLTFKQS